MSELAPDVVVLAVGGTGRRPAIPGSYRPRVTDVRDWLSRPRPVDDDAVVTVWGADRAGVATADALAVAGLRVLLLGAGPALAPEAGPREMVLVARRLTGGARVDIRLDTTLEAIGDDRLLVGHGGEQEWIAAGGPVLVSQGTAPRDPGLGRGRWRTVVVGEAADARSAADAIRQAASIDFTA